MLSDSALIDATGSLRRYAGLHSYSDSPLDAMFFFGRERETELVESRIRAERSLVFFGRSGTGKSSLLKASVFPALRQQNFFPFIIRFDRNEKDPQRAIMDTLVEAGKHYPGIEVESGDCTANLWLYLRTTDIWYGDAVMTPVLVFDQFEEVFDDRFDNAFREKLAIALQELITHNQERTVYQLRKEGKAIGIPMGVRLDVRVVFSLREGRLAELEALTKWLPYILDQRIRLLPMDREQMVEAIQSPAALTAEQAMRRLQWNHIPTGPKEREELKAIIDGTTRFRFSDDAIDLLLDVMVDDYQKVDLTMLQTVCRYIEKRVEKALTPESSESDFVVDAKFLGSKDRVSGIWKRFYQAALDTVLDENLRAELSAPTRPKQEHISQYFGLDLAGQPIGWLRRFMPGSQRTAARRLCEDGLLSAEGHRLNLNEEAAHTQYGVDETTLKVLQFVRLLRQEKRPGLKGGYYEISHDKMASIIFASRQRHANRQRNFAIASMALLVVSMVLVLYLLKEQKNQVELANERVETEKGVAQRADDYTIEIVHTIAQSLGNQETLKALFPDGSRASRTQREEFKDALAAIKTNLGQVSGEGDGAAGLTPAQQADLSGELHRIDDLLRGIDKSEEATPPVINQQSDDGSLRDTLIGSSEKGPLIVALPAAEFDGSETKKIFVSKYEITRADFAHFASSDAFQSDGAQGCFTLVNGRWEFSAEASWSKPGIKQDNRHPVVCVNWRDATSYARWLSQATGHCYRLPTEREWQYAAQGETSTRYWWGDEMIRGIANCVTCGVEWAGRGTAPVDFDESYPNPFNLHNTAGNVFEWTSTCATGISDDASENAVAQSGQCDRRVIRGGAWLLGAKFLNPTISHSEDQARRSAMVGIRLVRTEGACTSAISPR